MSKEKFSTQITDREGIIYIKLPKRQVTEHCGYKSKEGMCLRNSVFWPCENAFGTTFCHPYIDVPKGKTLQQVLSKPSGK